MRKNTLIVGAMAEGMVSAYLAAQGHETYIPASPQGRADLIYVKDGRPIKVQVKTSTWSSSTNSPHRYEQFRVSGKDGERRYTVDEVDEFWIVGTHLWCIPLSLTEGLKSFMLCSTNPSSRKTVRNYDPNDFIVVYGSINRQFRDRLLFNDPEPTLVVSNTEYAASTLYRMGVTRTRRNKRRSDA